MIFPSKTSRALFATSAGFIVGYTGYQYRFSLGPSSRALNTYTDQQPQGKMTVNHSFQTLFAVPLSCDGCVKSVSDSIHKLDGIQKVEGNLKDQLVSVEGSAAPSAIVQAIQDTGRDAILRGSGASNSAAVSILETFADLQEVESDKDRAVRGLARMVQVSSTRTLIDLSIRGVSPGTYRATIRQYGNLQDGARSTGPVWSSHGQDRGSIGVVQIWEIIGHAMILTKQEEGPGLLGNDENTVLGVIARSAGMWDNDKTVCSCTGKTLWDERQDELAKGML